MVRILNGQSKPVPHRHWHVVNVREQKRKGGGVQETRGIVKAVCRLHGEIAWDEFVWSGRCARTWL